jgi:hypothetical protein
MQALLAMLLGKLQSKLLSVGRVRAATDYPTGTAVSFLSIDGTNPPTVAALRLMDGWYSTYVTLSYYNNAIRWSV